MASLLLAEGNGNIFDAIVSFFKEVGLIFNFDLIFFISLGLMLAAVVFSIVRAQFTYDVKILKAINHFNGYFKRTPYINDENLVEVNDKFKNSPRSLRYGWQQFVLNRDNLPSFYMNTITCVDQPIKASAHSNTSTVMNIMSIMVAFISFILSFSVSYAAEGTPVVTALFYSIIIPIICMLIGYSVTVFLKERHIAIVSDVYHNFHEFESYINKACSEMPAYIDYEVLFTKKEIKDGIPALQEYLDKRALMEKQEKEAQELIGVKFEDFDFDELGVENALLLDRAMMESEKFFSVKTKLGDQIVSKENEMFNFQKSFDEVTKEYERKAQAVKENLKQLNENLSNTSVNIEANYIKKRYKESQQKLQVIEKDYELASIRFNKQQEQYDAEIKALKKEIAGYKERLEEAVSSEGKSYANKIYGIINTRIAEQNAPMIEENRQEIERLRQEVESLRTEIGIKQDQITEEGNKLSFITHELDAKKAELEGVRNLKEYITSIEFRNAIIEGKKRPITASEYNQVNNMEKPVEADKNEDDLKGLLDNMKNNPLEQDPSSSPYEIETEDKAVESKVDDKKEQSFDRPVTFDDSNDSVTSDDDFSDDVASDVLDFANDDSSADFDLDDDKLDSNEQTESEVETETQPVEELVEEQVEEMPNLKEQNEQQIAEELHEQLGDTETESDDDSVEETTENVEENDQLEQPETSEVETETQSAESQPSVEPVESVEPVLENAETQPADVQTNDVTDVEVEQPIIADELTEQPQVELPSEVVTETQPVEQPVLQENITDEVTPVENVEAVAPIEAVEPVVEPAIENVEPVTPVVESVEPTAPVVEQPKTVSQQLEDINNSIEEQSNDLQQKELDLKTKLENALKGIEKPKTAKSSLSNLSSLASKLRKKD